MQITLSCVSSTKNSFSSPACCSQTDDVGPFQPTAVFSAAYLLFCQLEDATPEQDAAAGRHRHVTPQTRVEVGPGGVGPVPVVLRCRRRCNEGQRAAVTAEWCICSAILAEIGLQCYGGRWPNGRDGYRGGGGFLDRTPKSLLSNQANHF